MYIVNYRIEFIWYKPHSMRIYYLWIVINIWISPRAPKNVPLKPFQTKSASSHNSLNPWPNVSMFLCNFISNLSHSSSAIWTCTLRFRRGTSPASLPEIFLAKQVSNSWVTSLWKLISSIEIKFSFKSNIIKLPSTIYLTTIGADMPE